MTGDFRPFFPQRFQALDEQRFELLVHAKGFQHGERHRQERDEGQQRGRDEARRPDAEHAITKIRDRHHDQPQGFDIKRRQALECRRVLKPQIPAKKFLDSIQDVHGFSFMPSAFNRFGSPDTLIIT